MEAVAVMLFHFFYQWVSPIHDSLVAILPAGIEFVLTHADIGADVFFVVSGFVIAHSLFGVTVTPKYAGTFIFRRSLRLDPPYRGRDYLYARFAVHSNSEIRANSYVQSR
jgi:peptidoglycan/LPS O-acetylase OafA/YrhL